MILLNHHTAVGTNGKINKITVSIVTSAMGAALLAIEMGFV